MPGFYALKQLFVTALKLRSSEEAFFQLKMHQISFGARLACAGNL